MPTSSTSPARYRWVLEKHKDVLLKDGTEFLVLTHEKGGRCAFNYLNARYAVHDEGFWNPRTIIERNDAPALVLKRHFMGTKATIELADGTTFQWKVRNVPLVKFSFLSAAGEPVLSYRLDATRQPRTVLEVTNEKLKSDHLVLLLVLGFHALKGVMLENDDANLLVLVA